jgi:membrane protein DedA with SNARE-associated domain
MESIPALHSLLGVLSLHPYVFIFIGLFFFGETVFLPSLYLGFKGTLSVPIVIALMITASLLSDLVWYTIGRWFPKETVVRRLGERSARHMEQLSSFFDAHRLKTLFLSKFVYGTRTIVQVLSGMHRTPFWEYMLVNMLGTGALAGATLALAYLTNSTLQALTHTVHRLEIGFLILVGILACVFFFIRQMTIREWFRS